MSLLERHRLLAPALVALAAAGVYANALANGFVYDDAIQVLENPWITDVAYLPEIFSSDFWGFHPELTSNYYRPLHHVFYLATWSVFGLEAWGFHLVNLLVHAANSLLVYAVALQLLRRAPGPRPAPRTTAFVAGLLFAVHPIHTEVVTWIGGIPDLAASCFFLLSFLLYLRRRGAASASPGWLAASLAAFLLAALSKEIALTLPGVIVAYEFACEGSGLARMLRRVTPYVAVAIFYLLVRAVALGGFAPAGDPEPLSPAQWLLNLPLFFGRYVETLLLPLDLNAFHSDRVQASAGEIGSAWPLAVSALFLALAVVLWRRSRVGFFAACLVAIPLLPALYFPAIPVKTFAERYLYLPSAGFSLLVALGATRLAARGRFSARGAAVAMAGLVAVYALGTVARNPIWKDDLTLWTDTVAKSPLRVGPRYNLAHALLAAGQPTEAIIQLRVVLKLDPTHVDAHNNLGMAYASKGRPRAAIREFREALKLDPENVSVLNNLGNAELRRGRVELALRSYQAALTVDPDNAGTLNNIGNAQRRKGSLRLAREYYERALALDPGLATAHQNLALAEIQAGRLDRARESLEAALRIDPDLEVARRLLAQIRAEQERPAEAPPASPTGP